jgi:hypothetical protein
VPRRSSPTNILRPPIRYICRIPVRTNLSTVLVAALLSVATVTPLYAQSLAAVAKKEEDRRKAIKDPAKVYTNKDIGEPTAGTMPAPEADASKPDEKASGKDAAAKDAAKDPSAKDASAKDDKGADDGKGKGQAFWRDRMKQLQTQADRDQTYLDAVQTRINALTTDFVNRDDPAQKANIERERQRNLGELERLKKAILDDKKAIADLEDEARRAGVPPGWLR